MDLWKEYTIHAAREAVRTEWPYAYSIGHIRAIIEDCSILPEEKVAQISFYLQQFDQMRRSDLT